MNEAEVDSVIAEAKDAGATILKQPQHAFWGGYHAFFADPDGHVWEIAHNPFFEMTADGAVKLPD
ncbi:MAG: VOC family protein [Hyphomicrobiales bacterium]|nr:VOC family protein [Hyphomicrobiales bacterium]